MDGIKCYLHLLVDNYSRYILQWRLQDSVSGSTVKQMLEAAISDNDPTYVQLLVDGGSENINTTVDDFLNANDKLIQHVVAQKDIDFSNSMVEAVNKIIKYNYLGLMQLTSRSELFDALQFIINDYNEVRPHNSLAGLTPMEAMKGIIFNTERRTEQNNLAKAKRLDYNRNNSCGNCL